MTKSYAKIKITEILYELDEQSDYYGALRMAIESLDAHIETEKLGKWLKNDNGDLICSLCGKGTENQPTVDKKPMFKYCPFCGKKMKGVF